MAYAASQANDDAIDESSDNASDDAGVNPRSWATNQKNEQLGSPRQDEVEDYAEIPTLTHRFRHGQSILCLAVTESCIFAGSQSGEILVFALKTYERVSVHEAHNGSVLGLCLSQDATLLFSSASDRVLHVWDAHTCQKKASLASHYDVGDVFSVSFSDKLQTVYLGCQNTSIQWFCFASDHSGSTARPSPLPYLRRDKFYGSAGPGGIHHHERDSKRNRDEQLSEIPRTNCQQYAHFGFVYCMLLCRGAIASLREEEILVTGGGDGNICIWTLNEDQGGRLQHSATLEDNREDADSVLTMVLDGTLLYSGRVGGEINVWDLETRQLLRAFEADNADVVSLAVGNDCLISLNDSGTARRYNQRYECVASWKAHKGRALASKLLSRDDRTLLLSGGSDNSVGIWDMQDTSPQCNNASRSGEDELLNSLRRFIAFRTVSSDERYRSDCRKGASYLRALLKSLGATTQMITTEEGLNPIVYASFRAELATTKARRKLLFYGHYDVISANNQHGKWVSIYARGSSDNKGPLMAAIYAVKDLVSTKQLACDIIFLVEGEEETGSRGFKRAVRRNKDLIGKVDWILLANSYWLDDEIPCLTYGLRGVIHACLEINSDQPDLHSGVDGSRLLNEPLKDLVALVAKLSGIEGEIRIPGFYSGIKSVSQRERSLYGDISESLLARNPTLGQPVSLTASLMARWREPSLTVHGFNVSTIEKATIIPHCAHVNISLRLVPGQDSEKISDALQSFLRNAYAALGSKNKLMIKVNNQAEPWLGDPTNFIFRTLERAVVHVWRRRRRGGSINGVPLSPSLNPSHMPRRASTTESYATQQPATSSILALNSIQSIRSLADREPSDSESVTMKPAKQRPVDLSNSPWKPLYIREGGSIPAIRFLEKEFGAPAAHLPCGQASDNAHLENERFRVLNLLNSREIFRRVFTELM